MYELPDSVYELLSYIPVEDLEVNDYTNSLLKSVSSTYKKSEYQFSYFAIHLIFMTYIYCTVWKIGKFYKDRYEDTLLFARPYNNKTIDLTNIKSIFEYSNIPEKDIFEFFSLIDLDKGYIKNIKGLVDTRNEMAHATGKIQITTESNFNEAIKEILSISKNINIKMTDTLRNFYENILIKYANGEYIEKYPEPYDVIYEIMILDYSLSQNELLICSEFGLSRFRNKEIYDLTLNKRNDIKEFHEVLNMKYKEIIGVE